MSRSSVETRTPKQTTQLAGLDPQHAVLKKFSLVDRAIVLAILDDEVEYVDHPSFHERDAERKLFDDSIEIPVPDVSWYHPVVASSSDPSRYSTNGSVRLTAEQERILFLRFNFVRYQLAQLRDKLVGKKLTAAKVRDLLNLYRRVEMLREQIAQTNLALVLAMAKRSRQMDIDFGEMVSEGNMALLRAIEKFDAGRGFKFSTYACRAIIKSFSRSGQKATRYRQMFPAEFDPSIEQSDYMERKREQEEDDCVDEIRNILTENRAELSPIEHDVIGYRFGFEPEEEQEEAEAKPMTLEQVGQIIGVTKERVRQIQNKALKKIRETMEHGYLA